MMFATNDRQGPSFDCDPTNSNENLADIPNWALCSDDTVPQVQSNPFPYTYEAAHSTSAFSQERCQTEQGGTLDPLVGPSLLTQQPPPANFAQNQLQSISPEPQQGLLSESAGGQDTIDNNSWQVSDPENDILQPFHEFLSVPEDLDWFSIPEFADDLLP